MNSGQLPKPVTLEHCVAFVVTMRRLLVVVFIVPLVCAFSPVIFGIYLSLLDILMSGFGFLSTIMAVCVTVLGRAAINVYAPSPKKRQDALAKSRVSLPLVGFILGRITISYLLYPLSTWLGLDGMLKYSPELPYMNALRLSACMLLLGVVILARFVGPVSVGKNRYGLLLLSIVRLRSVSLTNVSCATLAML